MCKRRAEVVHCNFVGTSPNTIVVAVGDDRIVCNPIAQRPDDDGLTRSLQRHLREDADKDLAR